MLDIGKKLTRAEGFEECKIVLQELYDHKITVEQSIDKMNEIGERTE